VGRRRSVVDRRPWRQPAGVELTARSRGLCRRIAEDVNGSNISAPGRIQATPIDMQNSARSAPSEVSLRAMMSSHVGVIRDGERLAEAVRAFASIERDAGNVTLRNMATTALLVAASAWARRESRGAQYRMDYPTERPELKHRTRTTLTAAREIAAVLSGRAGLRAPQPMIA
jgi:L-aspartate oxidase